MRVFSNGFLRIARATRKVGPVFRFFIAAAFKARELELRIRPDLEVAERVARLVEAEQEEARRELLYSSIRGAVRCGLMDVRNGVLGFAENIPILDPVSVSLEVPPNDPEDPNDPETSRRRLTMLIQHGDEVDREKAEKEWIEKYPTEPVPAKVMGFLPSEFERTTLNGTFSVTPEMRKTIQAIKRERKGCEYLVVVNKTNTLVSLGIGERGCEGVTLPMGEEPFVLTDHYSLDQWMGSSDFRRAVAKDWIAVVAANPKGKFLKLSPREVKE